ASADTVSAWKRARDQVAHRKTDAEQTRTRRDTRFEATEADSEHAINVGEEMAGQTPIEKQTRGPKPKTPADQPAEEGEYTSRLLAANRRARKEKDKEDEENQ